MARFEQELKHNNWANAIIDKSFRKLSKIALPDDISCRLFYWEGQPINIQSRICGLVYDEDIDDLKHTLDVFQKEILQSEVPFFVAGVWMDDKNCRSFEITIICCNEVFKYDDHFNKIRIEWKDLIPDINPENIIDQYVLDGTDDGRGAAYFKMVFVPYPDSTASDYFSWANYLYKMGEEYNTHIIG